MSDQKFNSFLPTGIMLALFAFIFLPFFLDSVSNRQGSKILNIKYKVVRVGDGSIKSVNSRYECKQDVEFQPINEVFNKSTIKLTLDCNQLVVGDSVSLEIIKHK